MGLEWHDELECPFHGQSRDGVEAVVESVGRPYQALGKFEFGTHAQFAVVGHALERVEVEPELRLATKHEVALHAVVVPHIGVSAEGTQALGEVDAPHGGELPTVLGAYHLARQVLVERLEREGLAEVRVPSESRPAGQP